MLILSDAIMPELNSLLILFQRRTWMNTQMLLAGGNLSAGRQTVTSAPCVMGLSDEKSFARYHHALNRAVRSPFNLGRCTCGI